MSLLVTRQNPDTEWMRYSGLGIYVRPIRETGGVAMAYLVPYLSTLVVGGTRPRRARYYTSIIISSPKEVSSSVPRAWKCKKELLKIVLPHVIIRSCHCRQHSFNTSLFSFRLSPRSFSLALSLSLSLSLFPFENHWSILSPCYPISQLSSKAILLLPILERPYYLLVS